MNNSYWDSYRIALASYIDNLKAKGDLTMIQIQRCEKIKEAGLEAEIKDLQALATDLGMMMSEFLKKVEAYI